MWLHFIEKSDNSIAREWGFESEWGEPMKNIPVVGDLVWLSVGKPDEDPSDSVKAIILSREWCFDDESDIEVVIHVEFFERIDPELQSDSQVWPLREYTQRMNQHKLMLSKIKKSGN